MSILNGAVYSHALRMDTVLSVIIQLRRDAQLRGDNAGCSAQFFIDMKYGGGYFSCVRAELPELVSQIFRLDVSRKNLMIAGFPWAVTARKLRGCAP